MSRQALDSDLQVASPVVQPLATSQASARSENDFLSGEETPPWHTGAASDFFLCFLERTRDSLQHTWDQTQALMPGIPGPHRFCHTPVLWKEATSPPRPTVPRMEFRKLPAPLSWLIYQRGFGSSCRAQLIVPEHRAVPAKPCLWGGGPVLPWVQGVQGAGYCEILLGSIPSICSSTQLSEGPPHKHTQTPERGEDSGQ